MYYCTSEVMYSCYTFHTCTQGMYSCYTFHTCTQVMYSCYTFHTCTQGMYSCYTFHTCTQGMYSCYTFHTCTQGMYSCYTFHTCTQVMYSCYTFHTCTQVMYSCYTFHTCTQGMYSCYTFHTCTQVMFSISDVLAKQPEITSDMRTILIDWMIELQENFELYHETLYLSVKLVDLYLSRKTISRENLQLLGATAMLIASKFEVITDALSIRSLYISQLLLAPVCRNSVLL